ncbi:MAG: hypothetical protein SGI96_14635 [Bacteroidota bacterium]|nr:hypothetical protein [Chitinophagaceae bacterium]MDZ4809484.1 hypothetical protein [Bacteroidota bacterium]
MRHYLFLLSIVLFLSACSGSKSPEDCKTAEGSQWSDLKKNCVKLSESKFTLKPLEGAAGSAYLVFSGDSDKAEALLPGNASTGVLIRTDDVKPWINEEWSLEIKSGYVLKKNGVIMYTE